MSLHLSAVVAARGLSAELEVAPGETLALLGPNGAGKSTLLALMAGLLRPDTGTVTLEDRLLTDTGPGRRSVWVPPHDRRVTLLAQEPLLFPHLSVRGNVEFGPRARGRTRSQAAAEAAQWLERIGVEELADRRPAALSGGQSQRVAVARALAAQPRLLLLDEPMAALDVETTPALRQTLRRVLAEQTCVIATHDVLDAALLADRIAVVEAGRIVEQGPTAEILGRPRSAFGARIAGLNLLRGTWTGDELLAVDGEGVHGRVDPLTTPGAPAVAVFRPGSVSVFRSPVSGSPRNTYEVEVVAIEPHGDLVRVRGARLSADVTPQSVAELGLVPGDRVWFSVKATEVDVYPA